MRVNFLILFLIPLIISGCIYETETLRSDGFSTYTIEFFDPYEYHMGDQYEKDVDEITDEDLVEQKNSLEKNIREMISDLQEVSVEKENFENLLNFDVVRGDRNGLKVIFNNLNMSNKINLDIVDYAFKQSFEMATPFYSKRELKKENDLYIYKIYFNQELLEYNQEILESYEQKETSELDFEERVLVENIYYDLEVFGKVIGTNGEMLNDNKVRFYTLKLYDEEYFQVTFKKDTGWWDRFAIWFYNLFN